MTSSSPRVNTLQHGSDESADKGGSALYMVEGALRAPHLTKRGAQILAVKRIRHALPGVNCSPADEPS